MRTGELAAEAGVNIQTLRYYERRGILRKPARTPSGYRQYPPDAVRLIRFIKRAQQLGFTLDEIEELLQLRDGGDGSCAEVRSAAETKIRDVDAKIAALKAVRRALATLVATCARNRERRCPILEALDAVNKLGYKTSLAKGS
jgi:Hg(II)-responsive transcriptional regulator